MSINQQAMVRQVGRLLGQGAQDRQTFVYNVARLAEQFGDEVYSALLHTAVHLEFGARAAHKHFDEVVEYWQQLCLNTGRDVDFRVALLDYFLTINKRIKNPKIIEIKIFEKTQHETEIDELTQLYNYRYFKKALELEVLRSQRYHSPLSLVLFDADDFKCYNDTNGHMAGNRALKKLAAIVKRTVREVDVVARFGGEEFAVLLPETNKQGAFTIADRIRQGVLRARFANGKTQPGKHFTVSGGVATLHVDADDCNSLINRADQALYQAKGRGKNQVSLYLDELREFERVRTAIMGEIDCGRGMSSPVLVQDISEGGLLFSCDLLVPMASQCHLSFPLPGQNQQVGCKVKVRRIEELERAQQYRVGASIVHMPVDERKELRCFIRELADLNVDAACADKVKLAETN